MRLPHFHSQFFQRSCAARIVDAAKVVRLLIACDITSQSTPPTTPQIQDWTRHSTLILPKLAHRAPITIPNVESEGLDRYRKLGVAANWLAERGDRRATPHGIASLQKLGEPCTLTAGSFRVCVSLAAVTYLYFATRAPTGFARI